MGKPLHFVDNRTAEHGLAADHQEPGSNFEVFYKLDAVSYNIVYHVREILCRLRVRG